MSTDMNYHKLSFKLLKRHLLLLEEQLSKPGF
jgi:hypothetical protein